MAISEKMTTFAPYSNTLLHFTLPLLTMSEVLLYLLVPDYLAQWYANECRRDEHAMDDHYEIKVYHFPDPVSPIRNSLESKILKEYLTKQPSEGPTHRLANLAIAIPYYRNRDPRIYNYLNPKAKGLLYQTMRNRFQIQLWRAIHSIDTEVTRKDLAITAWMAQNGIEYNDTNYNSIVKVYDRLEATYRRAENRKKSKEK